MKSDKITIFAIILFVLLILLIGFIAYFIAHPIIEIYTPEKKLPDDHDKEKAFCSENSREMNVCVKIYAPVCGWFDSDKVRCIKYPCAMTYSNSCHACIDEKVEYYTQGECPK